MKTRILSILAISFIMANANASTVEKALGDKVTKEEKSEKNNAESAANIKYIGEAKDNGIVFDVDFNNPTGGNFLLVISNSQGEDFYHQVFSGSNFHKTIMIKKDSDSDGKVTFALRNKGTDLYSKTFSINTETRVLRNVVVKSVN